MCAIRLIWIVIITGCVGGIIRDVVAGRPSIIMSPELYVTPAALTVAVEAEGGSAPVGSERPAWGSLMAEAPHG